KDSFMFVRTRMAAATLAMAVTIGAACLPAIAGSTTLLKMSQDSLLVQAFYHSTSLLAGPVSSDGADGYNYGYEQGKYPNWYVEEQRYGGDLLEAGLVTGSASEISEGKLVCDWAWARQATDGSFPGSAN